MSETLSLSIFTIEADRKPLLAFAARKHHDAEAFCADERVLTSSDPPAQAVCRFAMTVQFCAFG